MSLKEVFTSLESPGARISWKNDLLQDMIIDKFFNNLTPVFDAIILTDGHDPTSKSASLTKNLWCRVRPLQSVDSILPDPFKIKGKYSRIKKIINQHPVAWIKATVMHQTANAQSPNVGEVWQCRYTTKNKMGIELIKKVRDTSQRFDENDHEGSGTSYDALSWDGVDMNAITSEYQNDPSADYKKDPTKGKDRYRVYVGKGKGIADPSIKRRFYMGAHEGWQGKPIYNGNIPPELLITTAYGVDQGWLVKEITILRDILPYWVEFADAYKAEFGHGVPINSSYRPYATQVDFVQQGKPAAYPGTSNHGWGLALDIQTFNKDPEYVSVPSTGTDRAGMKKVPDRRTTGEFKYDKCKRWNYRTKKYYTVKVPPDAKLGTNDWNFYGAGFYSDTYYWINLGGGARFRWENPRGLRDRQKTEEPWHYNYSEIDTLFPASGPPTAESTEYGEDGAYEIGEYG